ncbi:MAG: bifunctional methylenetetrahydrofolate dehydrogenase/methenyltetrahydrofolate cyclohydrolase [Candidatus Puniceispirillum sp. TMED52]|nr:bifunctional methylenetetrahydrofolate dehydrogenase/methenyltetrahydrofolate cyclohydrolase FolD [SAR116 cluster bacterium]OUU53033.1 MAG: bifunctional methylenetetrahydrofolate dehydrogenase/methenyltetrahydrofolate cyclohydrolase [Candidatus Puniceispirillum sp. TMED52]
MSAAIIDGKAFAAKLAQSIGKAVATIMASGAPQPALAVVLVGNDPASEVYVRNKIKTTEASGMLSIEHRLPVTTSQAELLALIEQLNTDNAVDGILVQLPLPDQIDADAIINAISADKDVDGFHVVNVGRLWAGLPSLVPCTPFGSLLLLKDTLGDLSGKHAVIVGRSNIVGKPMAQLLLSENCTITVAHSRSKDLPAICREADILVAAVGRPEMIRGDWVKPGAVIIDVGINRVPAPERGEGKSRITGDVNFAEASQVASAITPVPGGVGPMTIACLLRNTLVAASRRHGYDLPADFM